MRAKIPSRRSNIVPLRRNPVQMRLIPWRQREVSDQQPMVKLFPEWTGNSSWSGEIILIYNDWFHNDNFNIETKVEIAADHLWKECYKGCEDRLVSNRYFDKYFTDTQ